MVAVNVIPASPIDQLHSRFETLILPKVERHAQVYFRNEKCRHKRADRIAETIALSWKWFVRLAERGKDATKFPCVIANLAARAVKSGRKVAGQIKARDVMNELNQHRHSFVVESLSTSTARSRENLFGTVGGQHKQDAFEERLRDNTVTPVPDQAAFRIDFPAWLRTLTPRERRIIRTMAMNERTKDLSRQFELSQARISQLRREFMEDWTRFCSDPEIDPKVAA